MNFNKRCISKEEFKKYEDSDVAYALYVRDNLKPNDYFRTFDGQIFKSMNVSPIKGNEIYYANGDYTWADISTVANFSDNLIDLIEVGDYVNGLRINSITEVDENHDVRLVWNLTTYGLRINSITEVDENHDVRLVRNLTTYGDNDISFSNEEIKSIVTKEQFSSMKYEVE